DVLRVCAAVTMGHGAAYMHRSGCRDEHACQHFDGGALAGPIRANHADELAAADRAGEAADRVHDAPLSREQGPHCSGEALLSEIDAEVFPERLHLDDRRRHEPVLWYLARPPRHAARPTPTQIIPAGTEDHAIAVSARGLRMPCAG